MSPEMMGVVRHLLTFGGGVLVTMGYIDADAMNQAVGALMTLFGVVWSVKAKLK